MEAESIGTSLPSEPNICPTAESWRIAIHASEIKRVYELPYRIGTNTNTGRDCLIGKHFFEGTDDFAVWAHSEPKLPVLGSFLRRGIKPASSNRLCDSARDLKTAFQKCTKMHQNVAKWAQDG